MTPEIEEAIEQLREAARMIWDAAQTLETALQEKEQKQCLQDLD